MAKLPKIHTKRNIDSFAKGLNLIRETEGPDAEFSVSDDGFCFYSGTERTKEVFGEVMTVLGWEWDEEQKIYYWVF